MCYLKYLWYVVKHKWFVFLECRKEHNIWLGMLHDWSKFLPSEFVPYARHFYGKSKRGISQGRNGSGYYKPADTGDPAFDFAWLLHQKRNKHHWQWWILPEDSGGLKVLKMHPRYLTEMICDWKGASRAQGHGGYIAEWWAKNQGKIQLHPDTREIVSSAACVSHPH